MAANELSALASIASEPGTETDPAQLGWLLEMLREAMTQVMGGDGTPLQKANAVARLGGLYLKAYRAAELEQENRALIQKIGELEQCVAALQVAPAGPPTGPETAPAAGKRITLSRSRSLPPYGLVRRTRRSSPGRSDQPAHPDPPDTNAPLRPEDEIQITLQPDTAQGGPSP